jgi:hypothetical protein
MRRGPQNLPPELFDALPAFSAHIIRIFTECELTPPQLFALMYVDRCGKTRAKREKVILRSDVENYLKPMMAHYSDSGFSSFITKLCDRELLSKASLSPEEKSAWYGKRDGRRDALILPAKGRRKIEQFKSKCNGLLVRKCRAAPQLRKQLRGWFC